MSTHHHADEACDHTVSATRPAAAASDEQTVEETAAPPSSEGSPEVLASAHRAGVGSDSDGGDDFLTPGHVAALFHVTAKTVGRWAAEGKIGYITTVGGHHRYRRNEIHALLRALSFPKTE